MTKHYNGSISRHATFWAKYRELPADKRFAAFLGFFNDVKREVEEGKCGLVDAAYALEPGCNDDEIYRLHEADLTFLQDAVEDMKIVARTDGKEAQKIWEYVVRLMDELVGSDTSEETPEDA